MGMLIFKLKRGGSLFLIVPLKKLKRIIFKILRLAILIENLLFFIKNVLEIKIKKLLFIRFYQLRVERDDSVILRCKNLVLSLN